MKENIVKLVDIQDEYIKFLEKEIGDLSLFAHSHGCFIQIPVYEKGCSLRAEIKKLKEKL